jgi:hypothetical protein
MSSIYELSSVAARLPKVVQRQRTRAHSDAGADARETFVSQCTQQSLQVWQEKTHFDPEQSVPANRVHSLLRQEEGDAKTVDRHHGFALVGTDTAHSR